MADDKFPRGAKPTPRHRLAAAEPFRPPAALLAPTQFAAVPKQLSMWCNGPEGGLPVSGDCVTAEEAFAKACWSTTNGLPELFVQPTEVERWAKKYGFWDGAFLDEVMDRMAQDGLQVDGKNYHDGPKLAVNYGDESHLQAAILQGPVKIAIDAEALPSGAGNHQGWYATGGVPGEHSNIDHCTGLCGFGPAEWLYGQLGLACPPELVGKQGYLHFTWSTIGFVDHAWIMSCCSEAWVRTPTTPEQAPNPGPQPDPTPTPGPTPLTGSVTVPSKTIVVPHGLFGQVAVTVPGGTYPVAFGQQAGPNPNLWALIAKVMPVILAGIAAGKAPLDILNDAIDALAQHKPGAEAGLTPGQWAVLVQMVLAIVKALIGG